MVISIFFILLNAPLSEVRMNGKALLIVAVCDWSAIHKSKLVHATLEFWLNGQKRKWHVSISTRKRCFHFVYSFFWSGLNRRSMLLRYIIKIYKQRNLIIGYSSRCQTVFSKTRRTDFAQSYVGSHRYIIRHSSLACCASWPCWT